MITEMVVKMITKMAVKTQRRFSVLLALLAILIAPAVATADTVTLTDWTSGDFANNAAGGGGPFKATTTGTLLSVQEFITLCLEFNEYFSYGGTYNFTLSDNAVNGGVAGGNPDPVSDATKWLYYQIASGGYSSMYTPATGLALNGDVGANFQNAVWYLEQERTLEQIGGSGSPGDLLASYYALTNQDWNSLFAAGHRVYAMNLTTAAGGFAQDQLAYDFDSQTTQVPEPASIGLFLTGLVGGAIARMRGRRARKGRAGVTRLP